MSKKRVRQHQRKQQFSNPLLLISDGARDGNDQNTSIDEGLYATAAAAARRHRADKQRGQSNRIAIALKKHWGAVALTAFLSIGIFAAGLKYLEEDAQRRLSAGKSLNSREQGFLASVNPFLRMPTPMPTPQLSKEYVYAGSRLLAVEDAGANAAPPADLAVWRPGTGYWYIMGAGGTIQASQQWGQSGDQPVPGDYDGDGKTDFCVFRASSGTWYVIKSSTGTDEYYNFGSSGDIPLAADFDGDGKSDAAVYRSSGASGTWYIRSSTTGIVSPQQFGLNYPNDKPVPADFDGDGKADIAVWRDTGTRTFYSLNSSNGQLRTAAFGASGDQPVPADFDGDGKADPAVWRSTDNKWYIGQSSNGVTVNYQFGNQANDLPVPNDYDADGKVDIAVWRYSSSITSEIGNWYIRNSSTGQTRQEHWGMSGDKPVPAAWRR